VKQKKGLRRTGFHTNPTPKAKRKGRLDPHRRDGMALDVEVRIRDEAAMATPRAERCEYCGKPPSPYWPIERHHLKTRSSGGSDLQTIDLCKQCHDDHHISAKISSEQLLSRAVELGRVTIGDRDRSDIDGV
jgi:hypothetical protein